MGVCVVFFGIVFVVLIRTVYDPITQFIDYKCGFTGLVTGNCPT